MAEKQRWGFHELHVLFLLQQLHLHKMNLCWTSAAKRRFCHKYSASFNPLPSSVMISEFVTHTSLFTTAVTEACLRPGRVHVYVTSLSVFLRVMLHAFLHPCHVP